MSSILSVLSKTTESSTNQQEKIDGMPNNEQMPSKMPSNENSENKHKNRVLTVCTALTAICKQVRKTRK